MSNGRKTFATSTPCMKNAKHFPLETFPIYSILVTALWAMVLGDINVIYAYAIFNIVIYTMWSILQYV